MADQIPIEIAADVAKAVSALLDIWREALEAGAIALATIALSRAHGYLCRGGFAQVATGMFASEDTYMEIMAEAKANFDEYTMIITRKLIERGIQK